MLAIVWAARHFIAYIYGRHVRFHTDHRPLSTLAKSKEPNGRLYRLLLKLQDLDYEIVYCPGTLNKTADMLSRNGTLKVKTERVNKIELDVNMDWAIEQSKDREIAVVRMRVRMGYTVEKGEIVNDELWQMVVLMTCKSSTPIR